MNISCLYSIKMKLKNCNLGTKYKLPKALILFEA